ncbi:MAG: thiol-disulfide oxidoreductase DCC family protein [Phycisphaeraceae bacterium]|nr:thiol-disulfide oxidoreductase DCC family protein [Phycisphaeraceae bacterium]
MQDHPQAIILFDGVCNLCNASVNYIIEHDPADQFRFASLQSEAGAALAVEQGIDTQALSSMVLIESGRAYLRSTATLRVYRRLRGPIRLLWPFILVPRPFRDAVYNFIAKRRYRWFGKREACRLPTEADRARFL